MIRRPLALAMAPLIVGIVIALGEAVISGDSGRPWTLLSFAAGVTVAAAVSTLTHRWQRAPVTSPRPLAPANLPVPPLSFVGRLPDVERVTNLLSAEQAGPRVVVIRGEAGMGKTALALRIANQVAHDYPHGQLFARLTGSSTAGGGAEVAKVLASFVAQLGISGETPPVDLTACRRLYEQYTVGRKVLVVLDDVPGDTDVTPLLPCGRQSAALLTTRVPIPRLDWSQTVMLEPLPAEDGLEMLTEIVGDERLRHYDQRNAAVGMVEQMANLPLALQLAGRSLAERPSWDLRFARERLSQQRERLGAPHRGGDASLDLTYALLPAAQQRSLRLLALLDSPEFEPWMLRALLSDREKFAAEVAEHSAWRTADRLVSAGLVERSSDDESGVPRFRVLDRVWTYSSRLTPEQGDPTPARAAELVAAERQRRERLDLFQMIRHDVFRLMTAGELSEAMPLARDVIALARERGDTRDMGLAWAALAELHSELGNLGEADTFARRAIETGDAEGQARGLRCRAAGHRRQHKLADAEADLNLALSGIGDRDPAERVRLLRDLAWVKALGPSPEDGEPLIDEALELCRHRLTNGLRQVPGVLHSRAAMLLWSGFAAEAREVLHSARRQAKRLRLVLWSAWIEQALGRVALNESRLTSAWEHANEGVDAFEGMNHRYGVAHCRLLLGEVALARHDDEAAVAALDQALQTFRSCRDRWAEANTTLILARAQQSSLGGGDVTDVAELAAQASYAFTRLGDETSASRAQALLGELPELPVAASAATAR